MVKINETYAIVSMIFAGLIYYGLRGRVRSKFSDASRGYTFARTRDNLLELEQTPVDSRNWRPLVAAVTDNAERDARMIATASWLEGGRGLLSVVEVVTAPELDRVGRARLRHDRGARLRESLRHRRIVAFSDTFVVAENNDVDAILQSYSIGALRPNTVVLTVPPPGQSEKRAWLAEAMHALAPMGKNIVVYKGTRDAGRGGKRIDLWWHGMDNGSLMALLAYLITQNRAWQRARVRMLRVVADAEEHTAAATSLRAMMEAARIDVDVDVVISREPVRDVILHRSAGADLVILGLARDDAWDFQAFLDDRDAMFAALPPTLLVLSSGEVDLLA